MQQVLTERQLDWLRRKVPNFADCEIAARRAIAEAEEIRKALKIPEIARA